MFGRVLDAEQLGDLCACGLQPRTTTGHVKLRCSALAASWWLRRSSSYRAFALECRGPHARL
jgi:hypothetical protein